MARRAPAEPGAAAQVQGRCLPPGGHHSRGIFKVNYSFLEWSGRGELNPGCKTPSLAYYRYTTARKRVLIHLTQALVFSPEDKNTHWRLGYFLFLSAGLYLPRSLLRGVKSIEPLPHISHTLAIRFALGF